MTRARQVTSALVTAYTGPVILPPIDAEKLALSQTPVSPLKWRNVTTRTVVTLVQKPLVPAQV